MQELFQKIGFYPADILLPRGVDLERWSVIACDQFTAQDAYWREVERFVGGAPSTLRLILPESRLKAPDLDERIAAVNQTMERYLREGLFALHPQTLIYVERVQSDGAVRHGLVGMVDLEQYDFTPGSGALIRATEGTVLSRLPPRIRVREHAPLELPHVMLLMDDPDNRVLGPLAGGRGLEPLYSFPLQQGGGSLRGWKLDEARMESAARSLASLCDSAEMESKYGLREVPPLLFAVGDGNHSLAAAKACYEKQKEHTPPDRWGDLPARYALVEVVNNHDPALRFEPIHRCCFGVDPDALLAAFRREWPEAYEGRGEGHVIEFVWSGHQRTLTVPNPTAQLAVGTLQTFLDEYLSAHGGDIDYIHDISAAQELGCQPGNLACLLPAMGKEQLFKTVMTEGVLPRKTFSMGHARDKRYYLEARRIR